MRQVLISVGGAIVGIITGALKGQTTETGLVRGAGIGAVTGAVTAVQLLELMVDGESLSKVLTLYATFFFWNINYYFLAYTDHMIYKVVHVIHLPFCRICWS